MIDWEGSYFHDRHGKGEAGPEWIGDFIMHSGRNKAERSPNAGLRIHIK